MPFVMPIETNFWFQRVVPLFLWMRFKELNKWNSFKLLKISVILFINIFLNFMSIKVNFVVKLCTWLIMQLKHKIECWILPWYINFTPAAEVKFENLFYQWKGGCHSSLESSNYNRRALGFGRAGWLGLFKTSRPYVILLGSSSSVFQFLSLPLPGGQIGKRCQQKWQNRSFKKT